MKNKTLLLIGFCCLAMMSFAISDAIDYLSVGSDLKFNNEKYALSWSSHPNETYFKQEYLRKSDKAESYEKMIMVEAIIATLTTEQVSQMKLNELTAQKKTNPMVTFKQLEASNPKEKIISFTISGGNILEWNVYKYQQQQIDNKNTIVLYAYSYRNYASKKEDVTKFFDYINKNESSMIATIDKTVIQNLKIKSK